jgi:hypothetical protein
MFIFMEVDKNSFLLRRNCHGSKTVVIIFKGRHNGHFGSLIRDVIAVIVVPSSGV